MRNLNLKGQSLIVDVTADDIERGCQLSSSNCPIARAMERCGFSYVEVYSEDAPDEIAACVGAWLYTFRLTKRAEQFAKRFDEGQTVHPCRMRLPLVRKDYDPEYEEDDLVDENEAELTEQEVMADAKR